MKSAQSAAPFIVDLSQSKKLSGTAHILVYHTAILCQ